ncbi:MAG TPA: hypothetical protein VJV03_08280 [Pyrinomonadaceae bacterium]|nr:hypothetical protein [Pyrinomonadaceae bacterium]
MNIRPSAIAIATLLLIGTLHSAVQAQQRDHLTPQEVELIKDTQILDKRIEVFIKAAERRVLVLTGAGIGNANAKQLKKDSEKWGELPTGSPGELISDIARILDEAITNIDDVSARDEKNPLIPKALRRLASVASRIVDEVKPFAAKADTNTFDQLTENAESIAQAASQLPPEVAKKGKGKEEKPKTTN